MYQDLAIYLNILMMCFSIFRVIMYLGDRKGPTKIKLQKKYENDPKIYEVAHSWTGMILQLNIYRVMSYLCVIYCSD